MEDPKIKHLNNINFITFKTGEGVWRIMGSVVRGETGKAGKEGHGRFLFILLSFFLFLLSNLNKTNQNKAKYMGHYDT